MQRLAIGCLCLIMSSLSLADELQVPVGQQGDKTQQRPDSGMSKQLVEDKFGVPETVKGPVGEPPITIWRYKHFTVYFEYDRVIHSVLHKD